MQQISSKESLRLYTLDEEGDPQGIVQEHKFDHTYKWDILNLGLVQENETYKYFWDLR